MKAEIVFEKGIDEETRKRIRKIVDTICETFGYDSVVADALLLSDGIGVNGYRMIEDINNVKHSFRVFEFIVG